MQLTGNRALHRSGDWGLKEGEMRKDIAWMMDPDLTRQHDVSRVESNIRCKSASAQ